MKNKNLKLKIALTNIKRIITIILFINIMPFYNRVVLGAGTNQFDPTIIDEATCYDAAPSTVTQVKKYLIILIPIAIAVILIIGLIVGIKKHKKKKMENKNDKKD